MPTYNVYDIMDGVEEVVAVVTTDFADQIEKVVDAEGKPTIFLFEEKQRRMRFRPSISTFGTYGYREVKGEDDSVEKNAPLLSAQGEIKKIEEDQRLVFGWAYVTHDKNGTVNVDKSGDFVDAVEEIEKSAYDFVLRSRNGDANHDSKVVSTLVESIVFTPEKIEKMGLDTGSVPLGWWVGFKINDDDAWARVKKGELRSFSIGGRGTRKKVEE